MTKTRVINDPGLMTKTRICQNVDFDPSLGANSEKSVKTEKTVTPLSITDDTTVDNG